MLFPRAGLEGAALGRTDGQRIWTRLSVSKPSLSAFEEDSIAWATPMRAPEFLES